MTKILIIDNRDFTTRALCNIEELCIVHLQTINQVHSSTAVVTETELLFTVAEKGHPPPPAATMNSARFNSKRAEFLLTVRS